MEQVHHLSSITKVWNSFPLKRETHVKGKRWIFPGKSSIQSEMKPTTKKKEEKKRPKKLQH